MTLFDAEATKAHYASGNWQAETLYNCVERHATERSEAFAFTDRRKRLTWKALKDWVDTVAAELHATGLRPGDRIACWSPNRAEMVVLLLAASRNGYVCTLSLHVNHTVEEVVALTGDCGVKLYVLRPGHGADAASRSIFSALRETGRPLLGIYALLDEGETLPEGATPFPGPGTAPGRTPPPVAQDADKITYLAFTSGTTGRPKAVIHSDNTLLANGRAIAAEWGHAAHWRIFCLGPLSHHMAIVGVQQMLATGCEYITNDAAKGESILDRIIETQADYLMGVPTHAIDLLAEAHRRGLARIGHVHSFYMSGAAIAPETAERILALGIAPQMTYGMTETGTTTSTVPNDGIMAMTRSVGRCVARNNPAYEIRIFDPANVDVELSGRAIGEVGGRGASLMRGYFGNQDATEKAFNAQGFFMSGDLGHFDEDGNIRIVGRTKDLIIRGGHNIYPIEIESLALRHPAILKAAAFPVPDARLGEKVALAVVLREGQELTADAALAHLDAVGLSRYDMPEYWMMADELPQTASGKILKRELTRLAIAGALPLAPVRWTGSGT